MDYGVNKNTQPWSFRKYPTRGLAPQGYSGSLSHDYDMFQTDLTRDPRSGYLGPEISGRYEYQQLSNAFYAWKKSRENMSEAEKTRMEQPDKTDPDRLRLYRNALKYEKDLPEFERREAEEYIKPEEERENKIIDNLVKNMRAAAQALPFGWRQHRSNSGIRGSTQPEFFYENLYTKGVQWELPTQAAINPRYSRYSHIKLEETPTNNTRLRALAAARMKLEDEEAKRAIEKQERQRKSDTRRRVLNAKNMRSERERKESGRQREQLKQEMARREIESNALMLREDQERSRKIDAEAAQAATEELEREESRRLQKELKQKRITIGTIDNKNKLIKQISERSHKIAASAARADTEETEREESRQFARKIASLSNPSISSVTKRKVLPPTPSRPKHSQSDATAMSGGKRNKNKTKRVVYRTKKNRKRY